MHPPHQCHQLIAACARVQPSHMWLVHFWHNDTDKNYFTGYSETASHYISLAFKSGTRTWRNKRRGENLNHIQANHMHKSEMFIMKFQAMVSVLWHRKTILWNNERARVERGLGIRDSRCDYYLENSYTLILQSTAWIFIKTHSLGGFRLECWYLPFKEDKARHKSSASDI